MNSEINNDWVEDVRRWYLAGSKARGAVVARDAAAGFDLGVQGDVGYEAAHPALQARHWPDAPEFGAAADR